MNEDFFIWKNPDTIEVFRALLRDDRVVLGSSDTVFGLLANLTEHGFNSLNQIKGRATKPYIVLINEIDKLKYFSSIKLNSALSKLLKTCWPGPLTVILPAADNLPFFLQSADQKIALRIPQHSGMLNLLQYFDGLFSTSANLAGQLVPGVLADVSPQILDQVAATVLDEPGLEIPNTIQPSTILDCSTDEIRLVRAGAYSLDSLQRIYEGKILT